MKVGIVGVGRMGRVLAMKIKENNDIHLFLHDRDSETAEKVGSWLDLPVVKDIGETAALGTVILAVPDREVISLIKTFNQLNLPLNVINIATNVNQQVLRRTAARHVRFISVKIIGQADEMMLGQQPVIIIDRTGGELVVLAEQIFQGVGHSIIGNADIVSVVNTIVAEKILTAAVCIEENLRIDNITEPVIVKTAIRHVAVGILKGYTDGNMGPFAREIVSVVKAKLKL